MTATMSTLKRNVVVLATAGAACAALVGFGVQGASAAPGDPVTGGHTTIGVSTTSIVGGLFAGVGAIDRSPATMSYDKANSAVDYTFPVTGGDGSNRNGYGSIEHGGTFVVIDGKTGKSVTVGALSLDFETGILSATPQGCGCQHAFDLASLHGQELFSFDPTTGEQELKVSDLELDCAGAKFLDSKLGTTVFKAGQHIGTLDTDFTNTQY